MVVVLGINGSGWLNASHDTAVALMVNGKLVCAIEEERLTRTKRAYDALPTNAIHYCLSEGQIELDDVDCVAFSWDCYSRIKDIRVMESESIDAMAQRFFSKKSINYIKMPRIELIDHHQSHAASAYHCSGFTNAAVVVADGQGETDSISIWRGDGQTLSRVESYPIEFSLGYFFSSACKYAGFKNGDEGKLMGLAPYGTPRPEILDKLGQFQPDSHAFNFLNRRGQKKCVESQWIDFFEAEFGPRNPSKIRFDKFAGATARGLELSESIKDFAASVQKFLEQKVLTLISRARETVETENLCLAGGVFMNCSTNGRVICSQIFKNVFIQPVANDAGSSIGAAIEGCKRIGNEPTVGFETVYLGPEYSNHDVETILKTAKVSFKKSNNISRDGAQLLHQGWVIGWFQGRMEMGPRALGSRSIIASPVQKSTTDVVNRIKNRELWRPFGPSIMESHSRHFFELDTNLEFMIVSTAVKNEKRHLIPAVVHVDGTSRPQSVSRADNPVYYDLLAEFEKLSGLPLILNTSFNLKNQPIVCTPSDALQTFFSSSLDYLIIEDYIVSKP